MNEDFPDIVIVAVPEVSTYKAPPPTLEDTDFVTFVTLANPTAAVDALKYASPPY